MRKVNKENRKLTKKDIKKALSNKSTDQFDAMLHNDLYSFRIKKHLYESGQISKKGFLFNDNIYVLPLGKKNAKGEIMIANEVMEIFDRYTLAKEFAEKGDVMTAFLVDTSDTLYNTIKKSLSEKGSAGEVNEQEYVMAFNTSYLEVTAAIVDHEVNLYLVANPDLRSLIAEHNLELTEK